MPETYQATIPKTTERDVVNALFLESKFPQGTYIVYGGNGICPGADTHASIFHKDTLGEHPEVAVMCEPADAYLSNIRGTDKYVFEFGKRIPESERQSLVDKVKLAIEDKQRLEARVEPEK